VDVTAVEHREPERPLEVVWHLRSLAHRRFLRLKVLLDPAGPLEVPSVWTCGRPPTGWSASATTCSASPSTGHPDLRRILMWEGYAEGHPLRKDFPLRGRFSRSEQLSQALRANPEARYSMEELDIAEAFGDLPADMRARLDGGEDGGE
jgi:NADH-quinone oxidoreductase subunit C